jgi:hypothetical protein
MKLPRRHTKLEEALYKIHLDIDGDKEAALNSALHQVRQLTSLIIGQDEIENHDVSLVIQVLVKERNKLRKTQRKRQTRLMGKDAE